MSNLYNAFLGLIPSYPVLVGVVTDVTGEAHTLELLGGSSLICYSQKLYPLGSKVYVKDKLITAEAPNNEVQQFRV